MFLGAVCSFRLGFEVWQRCATWFSQQSKLKLSGLAEGAVLECDEGCKPNQSDFLYISLLKLVHRQVLFSKSCPFPRWA